MKIRIKNEKIAIGTKRTRKKFLWLPKILRVNKLSKQLEFRWLCRSSWEEEMQEWVGCIPDGPSRGGYSPADTTPDTYGWRGTHWLD